MINHISMKSLAAGAVLAIAMAGAACGPAGGGVVEEKPTMTKFEKADKVCGYNGNIFYILRPVEKKLKTVDASEFGLSTDSSDNTGALTKALEYCKENPGTNLRIGEGKYHFSQESTIMMDGLKDILIDGTGAEFITDRIGYFMTVNGCSCLEIKGLSVDWARDKDPIDELFKVRNADPESDTFEMEFFQKESVDPGMHMEAITQCDPETFTFGARGSSKEWYRYQNTGEIRNVEKAGDNVLRITHSGGLDRFADGDMFILRHHVYDGTVFSVTGRSRDITFSSLNIFGSPGMAIIAGGRSSHFQVLDTFIGVDPEYSELHHVSLGADAFHFVNADGRFLIQGCDISRQGDDAINVHDGLGYVRAVKGNKAWMHASGMIIEKGDVLGFKDREFAVTDFTATVQDVKYESLQNAAVAAEGVADAFTSLGQDVILRAVTFDKDISEYVESGCTAWNKGYDGGNYVIRNNNFHENRARGILLQNSQGLCENNTFYKIQGMAIRIVMDIIPQYWQEGTGVDGLIFRGNTIDSCDYGHWGTLIEISTSIDGRRAGTAVFKNIEISGNTFSGSDSTIMDADNVDGLTFRGNTIEAGSKANIFKYGSVCSNLTFEDNTYTGDFAAQAKETEAK